MSRFARRLARDARRSQPPTQEPITEPFSGKIVIASPMMDMCHTIFCTSLVRLAARSMNEGLTIQFFNFGSSILPLSRQLLAVSALERGASHILWLDSDMMFPEDTLVRLLRHGKPIVAANCISRRPPFALTARIGDDEVRTLPESRGIQRVDRAGTGVMLTAIDVYKTIAPPWFELVWLPESGIFRGEDFVFCEKARAAGFEIWIDHDLSKQVEHYGQFGLSPLLKARLAAMEEATS